MDSHKFNMYAGSVIGSVLFFLLLGFFAEQIYGGRGGHDNEPLAFAVEVEADEAESGHEEAAVDYAALVAAADLSKGEGLFKKCKACHKLEEGAQGVGPSLWGIVGRDIASVGGYAYSGSLSAIEGDWTLETLQAFLESPKGMAADTKMSFKGLPKAEDRVNLIVYLNEADGTPVELAAAGGDAEAPAPEATTETATETLAVEPAATEAAATTEAAPEPAAEAETETAAVESTEPAQPAEAAGGGDFASLLAAADADAGKKVFRKCRACHKVEEGKNGVGPSLWGIVGSDIASVEGYKYSDAMLGTEGDWTGADLFTFLESPMGVVPGTKMTFPGVKDAQDRVNLITFLNEADGSPEPLQ